MLTSGWARGFVERRVEEIIVAPNANLQSGDLAEIFSSCNYIMAISVQKCARDGKARK